MLFSIWPQASSQISFITINPQVCRRILCILGVRQDQEQPAWPVLFLMSATVIGLGMLFEKTESHQSLVPSSRAIANVEAVTAITR